VPASLAGDLRDQALVRGIDYEHIHGSEQCEDKDGNPEQLRTSPAYDPPEYSNHDQIDRTISGAQKPKSAFVFARPGPRVAFLNYPSTTDPLHEWDAEESDTPIDRTTVEVEPYG
jgi:hypothetical protein